MARPPFVRLWPLHPLSGDTKNIEYTGGDAKPGFEITVEVSRETIERLGRRYTPFGRERIADTYVNKRKFYCPLPSDLEISRAWNPAAPPDDPSWLQISAELISAGHAKAELRTHTAPELVRLLRAVLDKRAEKQRSEDGEDSHPFRHLFAQLGLAISELIDFDVEAERTGRADLVSIQKLCKRVEAAVAKAHASVETPDARAVLRHAHAAFLAAANAVGSREPAKAGEPTRSELLTAASQARGQLIIWFEEPVRPSAEPAKMDALDSLSGQLEQFVRSRDVAERTRLRSSVLELSRSAEQICANWGDPGDVSVAFADLGTALSEVDDKSDVARLTRIGPIHSQIACWLEFRNRVFRLRALSTSRAEPINVFLAYGTAALNLAEEVCHWFPFRVPGSDGVLTERDRRKLDDGWLIPAEHGLLAEEISPRVIRDVRATLLARAVAETRTLGESRDAIPKLERVHKALNQLAHSLRSGMTGGVMGCDAGTELAAAITDATSLVHASFGPGNEVKPPVSNVAVATAEPTSPKRKRRAKRELAFRMIRDYLIRHPTARAEDVKNEVGCSVGLVAKSPAWQLNQTRLRMARALGVDPVAIKLNEKWLSDAGTMTAATKSQLEQSVDRLIEGIEREDGSLFQRIGGYQTLHKGATAQQIAAALGCRVEDVNRWQSALDELATEQAEDRRSEEPAPDEGSTRPRTRRPPV